MADVQTSLGKAISDPAFCDWLAASPEAILLGAPLVHGALPGIACDRAASGALLGAVGTPSDVPPERVELLRTGFSAMDNRLAALADEIGQSVGELLHRSRS